jgi:small subunit ribosomal protein S20
MVVANIKSQIKRNRQNNKRRLRNRSYRGSARLAVKEARVAIDGGVPESKAALLKAVSTLDKAAERGVIHKNNAARRKSRLMKAFAKMEPVLASEVQPAKVEPVAEPEPKKQDKKAPAKAAAPRKAAAKVEPKPASASKSTSTSKAKKPASSSAAKKTVAKKATTSKKTSTTSAKKGKAA